MIKVRLVAYNSLLPSIVPETQAETFGDAPIATTREQMVLYPFALADGDVCYIARVNHLSRLYCNQLYKNYKGTKEKVQALAKDLIRLAAQAKQSRT